MKTNPSKQDGLTDNPAGRGTVTRQMTKERALELAAINGRSALEVTKADWDQAKREFAGGPELDPQQTILESAPESKRWDPVPGSTGHIVPAAPSADEDEEGRSDNQRLVEEGVAEAEHDQRLQAAKSTKT